MPSELIQACIDLQRSAGIKMADRPLELAKLALSLEDLPVGTAGRPPQDIRESAAEIRRAVARGDVLSMRQVRLAAWCLWNVNTRLVDDVGILASILAQIAKAGRSGPFRALAANFLEAFGADEPGIRDAGSVLSAIAANAPENWARLHRDLTIFDVVAGPGAFARAVIAREKSPDRILAEDYGVSLMSAHGGYVRAVVAALLEQLAAGAEPDHARRIEKVQRYALNPQGKPLFNDMLRLVAEAILRPFAGRRPTKDLRDLLLAVILKALGDPRRLESQANWRSVPVELTNFVRSLLTEQSLRQFLDVVDDTTNDKHMWRYRRAFWEGVYNKDIVSEAWVVFGPLGAQRARREYGKEASFAELVRGTKQIESGHAVLLLRIGDSIVADWSHNGKCNIWSNMNGRTVPALYKTHYSSTELRIGGAENNVTAARLSVAHMSPETYSWQRTVAERIWQLTGRRITEADYAVRR